MSRLPATVIAANGSIDATGGGDGLRERLGHVCHSPIPCEDTPAELSLGNSSKKIGIHTSGKKVKDQILSIMTNLYFAKCDNFVPIVVLGRSSGAHLTSSAEKSAVSNKELAPDEQETTQASRDRSQTCQNGKRNLPDICWNQDQLLLEVTAEILQNHLVRTLYQRKHHKGSTFYLHIFPKTQVVKFASATKVTRATCRRNSQSHTPRATKFADIILLLLTRTVFKEERRSKHRYAIVVQDLATPWIQNFTVFLKSL